MKIRTLLFEKLKLILLFIIACFALNTQTAKGQEPEVITFTWKGDTIPKKIYIAATSGKPFTIYWGNETRTDTIGKGSSFVIYTQPTAYGSTTNEYEVTVTGGAGCVFTSLYAGSRQIVSLDVSKAPSLINLECSSNPLRTKLDVSNNTKLKELYCYSTPLTELDVSKNTALTLLWCYNSSLTSLKISTAAPFTSYLQCYNNKIPLSDLKVLPSIAQIGVQTLPEQTVNLNTPIMVDDAFYGAGTNFAITLDGSAAVEGTHYTTADGKITFKSTGKYGVTMTNAQLGSSANPAQIKTTFNVLKSTDATLSVLTLSQGTLNPAFNASTLTYTADVPYSTASITIDAAANDTNATLSGTGTGDGAKSLTVGDNEFNIVVTAQDGSTKTYKVTVTRKQPSTDANLKTLTVSTGTLSPAFNASTLTYTVDVPYSTASITINATANDTNASVTGGGVKTLTVGSNNVFDIVVTAEDGSSKKTYKVTVNRKAASTDATLSALTLSTGTLSPTFNASTLTYTVDVANTVTSITINATKNEANAAVTGDGVKTLTVGSNNVFDIVVTAEDGTTKKTYKVTVTRAKSSDATLSALTLSTGILSPTFNASTLTYTVNVANSVTSLTISATKNEANAAVTGDGAKTLTVGDNPFDIVVTAQDGTTKKTYKVTVTRAKSSDATLSALTVSTGTLSPTFNASTLTYTVNVANSVTSLTINATKNEANAIVVGDGAKTLTVGDNPFDIVVIAQDGTTKTTYKVTVRRAGSSDASLSALTVSTGTLSPAFNASTLTYTVDVAHSVTSITINATKKDATATVTGGGVKTLNVGDNPFDIVVTAQDGSPNTYTVIVRRAKSSDATLKTLTVSQGTLTPAFSASTYKYYVTVGYSSIAISATANEMNASLSGNGTGGDLKSLSDGKNTFEIIVTAEDGNTKNTYTVEVTYDKAFSDATLKSLTVSPGELDPEFEPSMTMYTVIVPYAITSTTIDATVNVAGASFTGGGEKSLKVGNNVFDIDVTSKDGSGKKNYKVNVIRKTASTNAALSSLTVSKGELTPKFDPDITDYTVTVGNSTDSIAVSAAVKDATASFTGDGKKKLIVGDNIFELVVKAQDGSTRTYKVTVTRNEKSTDATLSKLELSQGKLVPDFDPAVTDYTVKLDNSATSISFGTMFGDSTSTVTITKIKIADTASKQAPANELRSTAAKAMPLDPGVNYFVIAVTAEDGKSTLLYIITVIRGAPLGLSSDTRLSNLWLSGGATLTPDFKPYVKNYNVTVGTDTEEIQINAIASDFKASIEGAGVKRLAAGENRFNLKVTAEDKTQDIYTITITREGSAVGLEEITRDPIQVYPNPVQDYFRVKGITEPATVSVYSLQGTLMLQRKAEPDEHIYVGNLAKGIYLVRVNGMVFKVLKR